MLIPARASQIIADATSSPASASRSVIERAVRVSGVLPPSQQEIPVTFQDKQHVDHRAVRCSCVVLTHRPPPPVTARTLPIAPEVATGRTGTGPEGDLEGTPS